MQSTKSLFTTLLLSLLILSSCEEAAKEVARAEGSFKVGEKIKQLGKYYQEHNDYESLSKVVDLINLDVDTTYVKSILGEPIDMGFDYRYLVDSTGQKGCVIGAVFHINEKGRIDQKWIDEICE